MDEEAHKIAAHAQATVRHSVAVSCEFEPHSHGSYTVTALSSGRIAAIIGGERLDLSAGDIAFTGVGEIHSGLAVEAEFVSAGISPGLVDELVSDMSLTRGGTEIGFHKRVVTDTVLSAIASSLAKEVDGGMAGERAMVDALVRQMAVHLLRFHLTVKRSSSVELSRAGPVDRRLRRAIEFINDNYSRDLPLEEIADAAFLSEYHFSRLFKQITGASPHAYLASVRLDRARRMLSDGALSISQVAATVGYQSQSHFTRVFKAATGLTPRAYRDAHQAK